MQVYTLKIRKANVSYQIEIATTTYFFNIFEF